MNSQQIQKDGAAESTEDRILGIDDVSISYSGNLAVKNAIALTKDKETAFKELYDKLKEFVRAKSS